MSFWDKLGSHIEEQIDYDGNDVTSTTSTTSTSTTSTTSTTQKPTTPKKKRLPSIDSFDEYDESIARPQQQQKKKTKTIMEPPTTIVDTNLKQYRYTYKYIPRSSKETNKEDNNRDQSGAIIATTGSYEEDEQEQPEKFEENDINRVIGESTIIFNQQFKLPSRWPYYDKRYGQSYHSHKVLPDNFSDQYIDLLEEEIRYLWACKQSSNGVNQQQKQQQQEEETLTPQMLTVLSMMSTDMLTQLLDSLFYNNEVAESLPGGKSNQPIQIDDLIKAAKSLTNISGFKSSLEKAIPRVQYLVPMTNLPPTSENKDGQVNTYREELLKEILGNDWTIKQRTFISPEGIVYKKLLQAITSAHPKKSKAKIEEMYSHYQKERAKNNKKQIAERESSGKKKKRLQHKYEDGSTKIIDSLYQQQNKNNK
ncbi:hypothetical protein DFA_05364 [Cavenderia fasciculata]|uniref:Uncharacterized protein n=1 Tax=Cavenderia fasciculata TaxID=261658 RepID=F4PL10_CACFS|nr:uncharacterized protein DFA_05364 [Cavenderia fasciculata]EGG23232.1 hypothetical protein DFA_05364 [Cavenderia fasciculata]|eukprot:XP_004361083.1 hypothetical protein DFA_05364 [Cavenderia fasciculata]